MKSLLMSGLSFRALMCYAAPKDQGGGEADDEPLGLIQLSENLADVEKPPEVPPGVYTAEVQDVQLPTSGKGNQYFAVKFMIPDTELPPDVREHYPDGAVLFWNRNVVPVDGDRRAMYNLKKTMEALGLDTKTTTIDPNEWMGRDARIRVVMGKYQGEERAEIKSLEAAEPASRPAPARGAKAAAATPARGRRK